MDQLENRKIEITFEQAKEWYHFPDPVLNEIAKKAYPELSETEIPRNTKVWYKETDKDEYPWQYGYYAEFRGGRHYISTESRYNKIVAMVSLSDPLEDILPK